MARTRRTASGVLLCAVAVTHSLAAQTVAPVPLTLADAVARAAASATGVQLADAELERGGVLTREARADLLPDLRLTAGYTNQTINSRSFGFEFPEVPGGFSIPERIGPFSVYDARVSVAQPLIDLPAWKRLHAARDRELIGTLQRSAAAQTAASAAALAYVDAARDAALVDARKSDAALAAELLDFNRQQLAAGVATAIDVTRAETQQVIAQSALRRAQRVAEVSQIGLAHALALPAATRFELRDSLTAGSARSDAPETAEEATPLALAQRVDLRVQQAQQQDARALRSAVLAERLPRLELSANYGINGTRSENLLGTRVLALEVSIPVFDGLGREARSAQQEIRLREARIQEAELRRQLESDVAAAVLDLASGNEQLFASRERLALAQAELDQARARFANGLAGSIEVVNAQSGLNAARDADIDARHAIATARIRLARAAGVALTLH